MSDIKPKKVPESKELWDWGPARLIDGYIDAERRGCCLRNRLVDHEAGRVEHAQMLYAELQRATRIASELSRRLRISHGTRIGRLMKSNRLAALRNMRAAKENEHGAQ